MRPPYPTYGSPRPPAPPPSEPPGPTRGACNTNERRHQSLGFANPVSFTWALLGSGSPAPPISSQ
eukprot:387241-Pyramimonas_sp.AAC.1